MGEVSNTGCKPRPDVICLEGNGSRPSHRGNGYSVDGVMYTLNSVEVHCVVVKENIRCPWQWRGGNIPDHHRRSSEQDNGLHGDSGSE